MRVATVMGVLKCYHQASLAITELVMQQVGLLEGRVTRQLVISLLNHIRSFRWAHWFVYTVGLRLIHLGGAGRLAA